MAKYRKKPVVIEALRWNGSTQSEEEVKEFVGSNGSFQHAGSKVQLSLWNEPERQYIIVPLGHWVIKGVEGEFYPCAPSIFDATYEAVD